MQKYGGLFLKGLAMGAANVVPGVSGGTIALITGIYEELIFSVKSFDLEALRLLMKFRFRGFWQHINGNFLTAVFLGLFVSLISLARLFKYILEIDGGERYLMAFFFGLILVSVYQVGRTIRRWNRVTWSMLLLGTVIAVAIAVLSPASENASLWYLLVCGAIAMCSMILPGLSGSFVLILLGNYKLIMLDAVSELDLKILLPVAGGAVLGLVAFSNLLAWVFRRFHDQTIALMTGFVLGSLVVIWPWKEKIFLLAPDGEILLKKGAPIISGYEWNLPPADGATAIALGLMVIGGILIWAMEKGSTSKAEPERSPN